MFEDIKIIWDRVKRIKVELYGKTRIKPSKYFDEYARIYQAKKGNSTIWNLFNENVFASDNDDHYIYEKVKKGVRNLNSQLSALDKQTLGKIRAIKQMEDIAGYNIDLYIL